MKWWQYKFFNLLPFFLTPIFIIIGILIAVIVVTLFS